MLKYLMSFPVLLFASYADAFDTRRLECAVALPCTVRTLVEYLRTMPGGQVLPPEPLVAINLVMSKSDATIHTGDEVALIPPVAGG